MRIGEIVLRTPRYVEMKAWYRKMLGIDPFVEHVRDEANGVNPPFAQMCFFQLFFEHPYQEMLVLFDIPGTLDRTTGDSGLHHMQLRNASPAVLCERYRRLRRDGIMPHRAMDHGPSTSFYYRDPDQNVVEIAASNFRTSEQVLASFGTESYSRNPAGSVVDPEEYSRRHLTPAV
ncbi:MAG: VOC family protein [Betaproteobacteria bacterium]|nr:VOC family protein [Betaproteobacteria bacterium]